MPPETAELHAPAAPVHSMDLGGVQVTYSLRRRRRRGAITLSVDERGLRVGAPWHADCNAIESQLRRHAGWILKQLAKWRERCPPPLRWEDGESLMLLGQPLRLTLAAQRQGVSAEHNSLVVGAAAPHPAIAQMAVAWLQQEALRCFQQRVAHYHPMIGVAAPQIRLSSARGRWGSCHSSGRIRLNWRLIQMPLSLIDYVVAHELAHLREMNHSPRFWQTVARMVPDHAARRAQIRTHGYRYLVV